MHKPYIAVFDAYHLYHLPMFEPVIEVLRNDPDFQVVLTTSADNHPSEQKLAATALRSFGLETVLAATEHERERAIRALNPDVFICGWSRYPIENFVTGQTLCAMLYHGIGVKPSYWRDNHPRLNLRFVEGPYRYRQLTENGITTDLAQVGFAKLDPLFNGSLPSREEILADLGLDSSRPTILFAPTFYPSSMEPIAGHLAQGTRGYNLLIKLHMWVYYLDHMGGFKFGRQLQQAEKLAARHDHIRLIPAEQYNILPYYHASDLLISEASSTIYEMMAIDKPVIVNRFYKLRWSHMLFRQRLFSNRLDAKMNEDTRNTCYDLKSPRHLRERIDQALSGGDPFHEARQATKNDMLGPLDGQAAQRVRDELLKRLNGRPTSAPA